MSNENGSMLVVGKPYSTTNTSWPEGIEYNWAGSHELRAFLVDPQPVEIEAFRVGKPDLRLFTTEDVLFLVFRFGDIVPWSDCPYAWGRLVQRYTELGEPLPPLPAAETNVLTIVLADAPSGIVRSIRAIGLNPQFAAALNRAIRDQAERPYSDDVYRATIDGVYTRYQSKQLARMAQYKNRLPE